MINKTIWIDHQHAYIFEFTSNKVMEKEYRKKIDQSITDSARKFTHAKEHQKTFYHMLALELGTPDQLLIIGPGVAREEFKNHCKFHKHEDLSRNIILTLPMKSHPRKSEIIKVSRKYFYNEAPPGSAKKLKKATIE